MSLLTHRLQSNQNVVKMSATSGLSEEKYEFLSTYRRQLFCFADSITSLNIIDKAGGHDAGHHEGNE